MLKITHFKQLMLTTIVAISIGCNSKDPVEDYSATTIPVVTPSENQKPKPKTNTDQTNQTAKPEETRSTQATHDDVKSPPKSKPPEVKKTPEQPKADKPVTKTPIQNYFNLTPGDDPPFSQPEPFIEPEKKVTPQVVKTPPVTPKEEPKVAPLSTGVLVKFRPDGKPIRTATKIGFNNSPQIKAAFDAYAVAGFDAYAEMVFNDGLAHDDRKTILSKPTITIDEQRAVCAEYIQILETKLSFLISSFALEQWLSDLEKVYKENLGVRIAINQKYKNDANALEKFKASLKKIANKS